MNYTTVKAWSPWTVTETGSVGGYVTQYQHDFTFITVRGAGHMVSRAAVNVNNRAAWPSFTVGRCIACAFASCRCRKCSQWLRGTFSTEHSTTCP